MDWTKEATKVLIQLYEENELLYNSLNPNYKNRHKRLETLVKIAEHITAVTGQMCMVMDVRKKINGLRSQYHTEKLKVAKSKISGGNIYTPSAYWFPLMKFLDLPNDPEDTRSCPDESDGNDVSQNTEESDRKLRSKPRKNYSEEFVEEDRVLETLRKYNEDRKKDRELKVLNAEINSIVAKRRKTGNETNITESNGESFLNGLTQNIREWTEEMKPKRTLTNPVSTAIPEKRCNGVNENNITERNSHVHVHEATQTVTQTMQRKPEQMIRKRQISNPIINSFTELLANELQEISDTDKRVFLKLKREMLMMVCDAWDRLPDYQRNASEAPPCLAKDHHKTNGHSISPLFQKKKSGCSFTRQLSNSDSQDGDESDFEKYLIRHDLCDCVKHRRQRQETRGSTARQDCNSTATHKEG